MIQTTFSWIMFLLFFSYKTAPAILDLIIEKCSSPTWKICIFKNHVIVTWLKQGIIYPAVNFMFKVSNRNTVTRYEMCSKLTIKTPERRQWRGSGVFIVNFEHISHLVLVVSIVNFEQVNAGWAFSLHIKFPKN